MNFNEWAYSKPAVNGKTEINKAFQMLQKEFANGTPETQLQAVKEVMESTWDGRVVS